MRYVFYGIVTAFFILWLFGILYNGLPLLKG